MFVPLQFYGTAAMAIDYCPCGCLLFVYACFGDDLHVRINIQI